MPRDFWTQEGSNPEFARRYGLLQRPSTGYKARTMENAKWGDATIRFARNFRSYGEICTMRAVDLYKKPMLDIKEKEPRPVQEVIRWLVFHKVRVLNVAGNAERTAPGISCVAEAYFVKLFKACAAARIAEQR